MLGAVPLLAALSLALPAQDAAARARQEAERLLAPHGIQRFPKLLVLALETWLEAEALYWQGDYVACGKVLDGLWAAHPPGGKDWGRSRSRVREVFLGRYPCYYALRMLATCVAWRLGLKGQEPARPAPVTLRLVLVGSARGIQPRTLKELRERKGEEVAHVLDERLLNEPRILEQALRLFREYVLAMTGGRLRVDLERLHLAKLEIPVSAREQGRRHAGIAKGGMQKLWAAVSSKLRAETDWWWVIYPSHVPRQHPDFEKTEFITGGMGVGPDGVSPCFISDDQWLLQKPPHLGRGPYSDIERRAYLPHWLQHEFFHHLYRSWPELELEKESHQWFRRATWPKDFAGSYEPDYYHESLVKRLQTQARPPMHVELRYRPPSRELFSKLRLEALIGTYVHEPAQNDWHTGSIRRAGTRRGKPVLRWRNKAGVTWKLYPELANGLLRTGRDNPYYESNPSSGRVFHLVLERDASGAFTSRLRGIRFQGALYLRR